MTDVVGAEASDGMNSPHSETQSVTDIRVRASLMVRDRVVRKMLRVCNRRKGKCRGTIWERNESR